MLAQLRAQLSRIKIMKRLYDRFRRIIAALARTWNNVRGLTLTLWLMLVYYAILTPAGLVRRILGKGFPPPEAQRGWQKIDQRSSDQNLFTKTF